MAEIVTLDTLETRWERLRRAVIRCQKDRTPDNEAAVRKAEADYVALCQVIYPARRADGR